MRSFERDQLKEAVKYQDIGKGLGPRLAKVLSRGVDDLLDGMVELVGRYAKEIGTDPASATNWLSSVWGPYDQDWLRKYAGKLPEPLAGKWTAMLAAPRRDRQISRRKAIAYAARMTAERIEQGAVEVSGPPLGKVAEEASARTAYQVSKSAGVAFSFSLPNQAQIERVMESAGISKHIKDFSKNAIKAVEDEVVSGLLAGSSIEDIATRIHKNTEVESMVRARRIARTMSTDCAAEAKLREYKEIGVEEYEIRCVYDERTCKTCGAMDKKKFPVKGSSPRPSFHPNCRCLVVEVLPPELVDRLTRSARDEDGKTIQVPQSMTFGEWRDRYAKGTEAPGKIRPAKPRKSPKARPNAPKPPKVSPPKAVPPAPKPTPPAPKPASKPAPKPASKPASSKPKTKPVKQTVLPTEPATAPTPAPAPIPTPPEAAIAPAPEAASDGRMYPKAVAKAERGEPMSFDEADHGNANPGYSKGTKGYRINCQSCVVAYEMRRRGYDVEARSYSNSNALQKELSYDATHAWIDPRTGTHPVRDLYQDANDPDGLAPWLESRIEEGARYSMSVAWQMGGGHIVTVERDEDGVRIYDPQSDKIFRGDDLYEKYSKRVMLTGKYAPRLMRVDNLEPNGDMADSVLKKKAKPKKEKKG